MKSTFGVITNAAELVLTSDIQIMAGVRSAPEVAFARMVCI